MADSNPITAQSPRAAASESSGNAMVIYLMVFSMLLPIRFTVVGAELFPMRLIALVLFLPFFFKLLSGAVGRFRAIDGFIFAYAIWTFVSFLINHGLGRLPLATVTVGDLLGGYLLGRVAVRSAQDFRVFIRAMIIAAFVMLPFALVEFVTNFNGLQKIFSPFFDTFHKGRTSYGRLGFERVMAGFAHPILYGFFCSLAVGTLYFTYRAQRTKAIGLTGFFLFMTFMSLSSGPFLSAVIQVALIIWGKITGGAWKALSWISVIAYVVVDLLSNRTPITIAINYVTFNSDTAWYRVAQWRNGIEEIKRNPVIGIGLGEWDRPSWLGASIDNFWLLITMRHGVPVFIFIFLALFLLIKGLTQLKSLKPEDADIRTGYMITLTGVLMTLATVHIWGAAGIFIMSFFGMGIWLLDAEEQEAPHTKTASSPDPSPAPADTQPETSSEPQPRDPAPKPSPRTRTTKRHRPMPMVGRIERRREDE